MTYSQFRRLVADKGWSMSELRCDVSPSDELLMIMDSLGLDQYERFVMRLRRESSK